jgi:hypothetical protein
MFALSNGIICLNFKNIMLQEIDISNVKVRSVILMIILYINILFQLKLGDLTIFESFLIIKFNGGVIMYFVM